MSKLISSQRFLDSDTVDAKAQAEDFRVTVSPEFLAGGVMVQVVLDGHHSLAAAKAAGVAPELVEANATDDDRIALLSDSADAFLEACWMDSDYYDTETGTLVF